MTPEDRALVIDTLQGALRKRPWLQRCFERVDVLDDREYPELRLAFKGPGETVLHGALRLPPLQLSLLSQAYMHFLENLEEEHVRQYDAQRASPAEALP